MTITAENYEHQGVSVEINYEEFDIPSANPREGDLNLSTFFLYRPGYELGDEQLRQGRFEDIPCPRCGEDPNDRCRRCGGVGTIAPTLPEWLACQRAISFTPLFILEHSGLTISSGATVLLSDRDVNASDTDPRERFPGDAEAWDSSFSGFALVRPDDLQRTGCRREDIPAIVSAEVAEYALYLEGQVFWFVVGRDTPFEDSCHGFLGMDGHLRDDANSAAGGVAVQLADEARERAEWAARDVITVG